MAKASIQYINDVLIEGFGMRHTHTSSGLPSSYCCPRIDFPSTKEAQELAIGLANMVNSLTDGLANAKPEEMPKFEKYGNEYVIPIQDHPDILEVKLNTATTCGYLTLYCGVYTKTDEMERHWEKVRKSVTEFAFEYGDLQEGDPPFNDEP